MAYTEQEFNYYIKKPKQINARLDEELLLALVDVNSSWLSYMKPHTLDFVKKVIAIDPTTFPYADRNVFTIQYLEEVISTTPSLIQYVYEPNDDLIKLALSKDLNIISFFTDLSQSIYKWIVDQNGMLLSKIPSRHQTEEIVEVAITQNYLAYKYASFKNLKLDRIVVEQDVEMVKYISDNHVELIEYILEYNPMFMKFFIGLPELTDSLIKATISRNPIVYRLLVNPTMDMMKYAALQYISLMDLMPYSEELINYVLEYNGLALKYVKKKELFVIKEAIKKNVLALQFVDNPRQFLIDYAFSLNGIAIQFIVNPTQEQYASAVSRNGMAIKFVPHENQTESIQLRALSEYGANVLQYITPLTTNVTLEIIRIEPSYIFGIENPTDEMYIAAFESNGQLIKFYDDWTHFFSDEVIVATLSGDGTLLEDIENKSASMISAAIGNFPSAIQWVQHQTTAFALQAVELDPRTLLFVQPSVMDEYLLDLAISINPDYFTKISGVLSWEQWLKLLETQGE